ncbi:hypothetical protein JCM10212_002240 [Sporobolomyces blumeae]
MPDSLGYTLPSFSGALADDWALHEERLKAWLHLRQIPFHATDAVHSLVLSLAGSAAWAFHREVALDAPERVSALWVEMGLGSSR